MRVRNQGITSPKSITPNIDKVAIKSVMATTIYTSICHIILFLPRLRLDETIILNNTDNNPSENIIFA